MQKKPLILALLAGIALSGAAQATLTDRGGGLIYDNDLNITWLADANYAQTSDFDTDGRMNWTNANAWATDLSYGGYTDWRLPATLLPDATCGDSQNSGLGYNCTGSEMGHLFYTEGGVSAYSSITTSTTLDDYFTNMQSSNYWSGTEWSTYFAYGFNMNDGYQYAYSKTNSLELYAWAVRPGDVAAALPPDNGVPPLGNNVPEPATLLLLGLGLAGLGAMRRRKAA